MLFLTPCIHLAKSKLQLWHQEDLQKFKLLAPGWSSIFESMCAWSMSFKSSTVFHCWFCKQPLTGLDQLHQLFLKRTASSLVVTQTVNSWFHRLVICLHNLFIAGYKNLKIWFFNILAQIFTLMEALIQNPIFCTFHSLSLNIVFKWSV